MMKRMNLKSSLKRLILLVLISVFVAIGIGLASNHTLARDTDDDWVANRKAQSFDWIEDVRLQANKPYEWIPEYVYCDQFDRWPNLYDCGSFYQCTSSDLSGIPIARPCAPGLQWDPIGTFCNYPTITNCVEETPYEPEALAGAYEFCSSAADETEWNDWGSVPAAAGRDDYPTVVCFGGKPYPDQLFSRIRPYLQ